MSKNTKNTRSAKNAPAIRETITLAQVEDRLLSIRGQNILLDSDVATLYDVETREVNQAIKNNPGKFPDGYIIQLGKEEWENELIKNFDKFNRKHYPGTPKAFTEKGLYMLATILKGKRAAETTIAIVETYAKIRELARTVARLSESKEKPVQQSLMQRGGEIMADILGEGMKATESETTYELNFALMKLKHTVRRKPE